MRRSLLICLRRYLYVPGHQPTNRPNYYRLARDAANLSTCRSVRYFKRQPIRYRTIVYVGWLYGPTAATLFFCLVLLLSCVVSARVVFSSGRVDGGAGRSGAGGHRHRHRHRRRRRRRMATLRRADSHPQLDSNIALENQNGDRNSQWRCAAARERCVCVCARARLSARSSSPSAFAPISTRPGLRLGPGYAT